MISLTKENKQALAGLLSVGRWANKSEIVRYGLHLVTVEVEAEKAARLQREKEAAELAKAKKRSRGPSRRYRGSDK